MVRLTHTFALRAAALAVLLAAVALLLSARPAEAQNPTTLALSTDAASNTVAESGGTVMVTATLNQAAADDVSVTLTAAGGSTATSADYGALPTITIPADRTSGSGSVVIVDDDLDEDNETIVLTATASGLTVTVTNVTLTITDDDTAGVTLSETTRTVEVDAQTTYAVTLDSQPTASVTITPTSADTSTSTVSAALTFTTSNWDTPQVVTVTGEAAGTVSITHAATGSDTDYTGLTIDPVSVTVRDAGKYVRITSTLTASEGSNAELTVSLGEAAPTGGLRVSFAYDYAGIAATADDTGTTPTTLTITANQNTGTLSVPITQDALVEDDETFTVTVSATSTWTVVSGEGSATVTIRDDDARNAKIAFGRNAASASALSTSTAETGGTFNVPITVSHLPQSETIFNVEVLSAGTATEGTDYTIATKSVTFTKTSDKTQNLAIAITDDMLVEGDQTIVLRIADRGSTGLGRHYARHDSSRQATVTITDDDAASARIAFGTDAAGTTNYSDSAAETGGTLNVPVTVSALPESDTTIGVSVLSGGTAAKGTDYTITTESVTFGPNTGTTTQSLAIAITNDMLVEDNETISLRIADSGSTGLGRHYDRDSSSRGATVTITDDDRAGAKIAFGSNAAGTAVVSLSTTETDADATFDVPVTVNRRPGADTTISVSVVVASTTATAADYAIDTKSVTFTSAGSMTENLVVTIKGDALVEEDQVITLRLADSASNDLGRHYDRDDNSRLATVTITDDESPAAQIAFGTSAAGTSKYTPNVNETDGTIDVPVIISDLPESDTTFSVEVLETETRPATEGTGTTGDYSISDKTVMFGPTGAKSKNIRVQLRNNQLVEHPETIELRIVAASSTSASLERHYERDANGSLATVTITDDDAAAAKIAFGNNAGSMAKHTVSVRENVSPTVSVPVSISHAPSEEVTFSVEILAASTAADTPTTGDYSISSKQVTFPSGSTATQNLTFNITTNDLVEDDKTIELRIVAADTTADDVGDYYARDANGALATVTIQDDDQRAARVSFGAEATSTKYTTTAREGETTITVPISISHLPESNTTLSVQVQDASTARHTPDPNNPTGNPRDFHIATPSVTFTSTGQRTANLTIAIDDDVVEEDTEKIVLSIAPADTTPDDLGDHYDRDTTGATAEITLTSEDAVGIITLSVATGTAELADGSWDAPEETSIEVIATADIPVGPGGWRVRLTDVTGMTGETYADRHDYRFNDFTIPEGQTQAKGSISFPANPNLDINDLMPESEEKLVVSASSTRKTRTLNAKPDAGLTFTIRANNSGVRIDGAGNIFKLTTGATTTYDVKLYAGLVIDQQRRTTSTPPTHNVTVTPTSADTSRVTVSGPLTFTPQNYQDFQKVTITAVASTTPGGAVVISHTTSSTDPNFNNIQGIHSATVAVADPVPDAMTYALSPDGVNEEAGSARMVISLGQPAPTGGLEFSVSYAYGTASASDTGTTPTTVTVDQGERKGMLSVPIVDDALLENIEQYLDVTITTSVSGWTPRQTGANSARLRIFDNEDSRVAFGIASLSTDLYNTHPTVDETAGIFTVPITVSHLPEDDTTFTIAVDNRLSSAVEGSDFTIPDKTVTFTSAGPATQYLTVQVVDDDQVEDNERLWLKITIPNARRVDINPSRAPGLTLTPEQRYLLDYSADQAIITIDSEDGPSTLTLTVDGAATTTADEGGSVEVTATLDKTSEQDVNVTLGVAPAGTTAQANEYFLPGQFTIRRGQRSVTQTVLLADDEVVDGPKTLELTATTVPLSLTVTPATITIRDTDVPGAKFEPATTTVEVVRGRSAEYGLRLNTRPAHDVTVTITIDDPTIASFPSGQEAGTSTLTFTPDNWKQSQTVRVRGLRQATTTTLTHAFASTDTNYDGLIDDPAGDGSGSEYTVRVNVVAPPPPPRRSTPTTPTNNSTTDGSGGAGGGGGGGGGFLPSNSPPAIEGPRTVQYPEHGAEPVATFDATDPDRDAITWSISGGDAARFRISRDGGVLTFVTPPDYENPLDLGRDNTYEITVVARDDGTPGESDDQRVNIEIRQVNEVGPITGRARLSVAENSTSSIGAFRAVDPEGDALSWTLTGPDAALFSIDADGTLTVVAALDFEAPASADGNNVYSLVVVVTDDNAQPVSRELAVTVEVSDVQLAGSARRYDRDGDEDLDRGEVLSAVRGYFDGDLTLEETLLIILLYLTGSLDT